MQINPSQVTDEYWLFAERKQGTYPPHSKNGGNWLIFVPVERVDQMWLKIKSATEAGKLGEMSKVATAKDNSLMILSFPRMDLRGRTGKKIFR